MSRCRIRHTSREIETEILLPSSKSESNRAIVINGLSGNKCILQNLSSAHDTKLMLQLLGSAATELNVEDAGTVMRFLTAYFAISNQPKTLTGSARMLERPVGLLVEALRELGADIDYLGIEGYPPLQVNGIDLSWPAQEVTVSGKVSSQFISALLLVAPKLPYGLKLHITDPVLSRPYIEMTLAIMRHFGAKVWWAGEIITVEPVPYSPAALTIEADWSAAGYWYSMAALAKKATIVLPNLRQNSFQADKVVVGLLQHWGVETTFTDSGILIQKKENARPPDYLTLDFSDCPDLAQTIIVLSAVTGTKLQLKGLESLKIKETDRIAALQTELKKLGALLIEKSAHEWELEPALNLPDKEVAIETYHDHRMALAFAPLALLFPVNIAQPEVVKKSYPELWRHLQKAGFSKA